MSPEKQKDAQGNTTGGNGDDKSKQVKSIIEKFHPDQEPIVQLYKKIHQDPELSGCEENTAKLMSGKLQDLGFSKVHTKVGGHGVIGIYENGDGPVVLVRSELDALPVEEKTGLPYASKKRMKDADGVESPVSHACGHDMHMACLVGAVELLCNARESWSGTLVCVFQPSEETISGAQGMVKDGFHDLIPKPDICLAQHCLPQKAGRVMCSAGPVMTASDAYNVRIYGKGGHGSDPAACLDPIVTAATIVTRLQTIVSREVDPSKHAVVTCATFHAGTSYNVIPDHADLQINVRTYEPKVRQKVRQSIERIIKAECKASALPKDPDIDHFRSTPSTINEQGPTEKVEKSMSAFFGENAIKMPPAAASEDFSILTGPGKYQYFYWSFGCTDPEEWDEAEKNDETDKFPGNHNPNFAPVLQPTLKTGIESMCVAALTFLDLK